MLTLTDLLADSYCPMAIIQRKSGPRIPTAASFALSRNRCHFNSVAAGTLTQTDVQQQRKIVRRHDDRISNVPRPLFGGTQPFVILSGREEEFITRLELDANYHAVATCLEDQHTDTFGAIATLQKY